MKELLADRKRPKVEEYMENNFEGNGFRIQPLVVGTVQTNAYVISNENTKKAVVLDPGAESGRILSYLKSKDLELEAILLTHGHFDHIMGINGILENKRVPVYAYEIEQELLEDAGLNCSVMVGSKTIVHGATYLRDQATIEVAGYTVKLIATPGHTKGSCCFYFKENEVLFSGDTLFMESIGRTDLPTGNSTKIIESVKSLMNLPDDTIVYPGHGPATSISYERTHNPFVNGMA